MADGTCPRSTIAIRSKSLRVLRAKTARSLTTFKASLSPQITKGQVLGNAVSWSSGVVTVLEVLFCAGLSLYNHRLGDLVLSIILGGALGSWVGFLNGLLVVAITNNFFFPLKSVKDYRQSIALFTPGLGLTFLVAFLSLRYGWEPSLVMTYT